jgi:lipopolysaccharide transport system permease protein
MRAPGLIISNSAYVTRVVFPLEILPVTAVIAALINAVIGFVIVLLGNLIFNGSLHLTVLLLPLVLAPFLLLVLALVYLFSALGTYVRDLSQVIGLLVTASLFLTPIFYPIENVPARFQFYMRLNPLTIIVEDARAVILYGKVPNFIELGVFMAVSLCSLSFGYWLFQRLRGGFADVI